MKKNNYFDGIEDCFESSNDSETITRMACNSDFEKGLSRQKYEDRGFLKDGELVVKPEEVIGLNNEIGSHDSDDTWSFNHNDDNNFIVITDDDTLTASDIEEHLMEYIKRGSDSRRKEATFFVFNHFHEDDIKFPIHGNSCFEFKGKFVFVKAVKGWVWLSYDKVIHVHKQTNI